MSLSHKNITRIKNVSNKETGRAYLDEWQEEFNLHYPDRFKNSINETRTDEIIVLYQRIPLNGKRYLTHLVRPINYEIIETGDRKNYNFGHLVETIAFTTDQFMINFESTRLKNLDFRNRAWGNSQKLIAITGDQDFEDYQKHIWKLCEPFIKPNLKKRIGNFELFLNDELQHDFESEEGKEKFKQHRIRERDGRLTARKKQEAIKNGNFNCEVCNFSFVDFYSEEYLECHHKIPIHLGERITRIQDLALVCANCHRMLHRKIDDKYLSIDELKQRIMKKKTWKK